MMSSTARLALAPALSLAPALLLAACAPLGEPQPDDPTPPPSYTTERLDLRAQLGPESRPSGIAVDPESGERFVIEPALGLFRMEPDGRLVSIWTPTDDLPPLNDVCAIGGGRFVAAADGDGYIIDLVAGAARQHFCLEPEWDPGFAEPEGPIRHINRSVACDVAGGLIYGQPSTVPAQGEPNIIRHELASYLLATGADQRWLPLPAYAGQAGGMAMLESGVLVLGWGDTLMRMAVEVGPGQEAAPDSGLSLAEHGVGQIEGLALTADALLVLDDTGHLTTVPRASVPWL